MAVWVNSAAAAWLSMITDAADFCRYSRSRADMWIGTFLAAVLGQGISVFLGGFAIAAVAAKTSNPFAVMAARRQPLGVGRAARLRDLRQLDDLMQWWHQDGAVADW
jgi:purine-cytosine permease-like protein